MSQKYIYWKWGNGEGIMQKSLRKNNKNTEENSKLEEKFGVLI